MGVKNTVFFLDLNTLDKKIDENLKKFAKQEDLEEKDIVKIIYNEARRIGEKDKVKVTFKIMDGAEDEFRVIVESANVKYKGTVIYPYEKVCSEDFSFMLDSVCGKITLYNKKEDCRKITVTIDNVALDLFAMTFQNAKDFLKGVSDRKSKGGYLEFPDSVCFKQYGIKLNAKKEENGDIKVDSLVASIDIFNKEEFFKEYYFEEEKEEEKYDVNIPLPDEYNYEKKKEKNNKIERKEIIKEVPEKEEIEIELPEEKPKKQEKTEEKFKLVEEPKENKIEVDKRQEELERIRKRQDEELERVKAKLKKELEDELNKSIKKYDEENEKRLEQDKNGDIFKLEENKKKIEEFQQELKNQIGVEDIEEKKVEKEEKNEIEEIDKKIDEEIIKIEEEPTITPIIKIEKENRKNKEKEENKEANEDKKEETVEEIPQKIEIEESNNENIEEIKELERLLEEERKQQEILEKRIVSKLEELKKASNKKKQEEKTVIKVQNIDEPIKINEPKGFKSYEIESYKGIREQGSESLDLYFGQSKNSIRKYFGGQPKEIREYDEMELYDVFYAYYDEEDKCTGIGIYNQDVYKDKIALYMFGQNLITMKYRDIVKLIKKNDYNAIEDDDGIISLKYGISVDPKETSNYKDEIGDVIHIFKKGYYDEVYENF